MGRVIAGCKPASGEFKELAKPHMRFLETAQMSPYFMNRGSRYKVVIINPRFSNSPKGRLFIVADEYGGIVKEREIIQSVLIHLFPFILTEIQFNAFKNYQNIEDQSLFLKQEQTFNQLYETANNNADNFSEKEILDYHKMAGFIEEQNKYLSEISGHAKELIQTYIK
ncbi:hypothetical protein [Alteribacillus sp. HJP-4]|uniref:hypothetical protein n=1 Tax=Alteribacillus sp. HJP-4 TaxID=2775394 RepID=UPI0035CCD8EC